ncbi:MAG: hypothetical protein WCI04_04730 [archaeon]
MQKNALLLILSIVLAVLFIPFTLADIIGPEPISFASGSIIALFCVNFIINFVIIFCASWIFGRLSFFKNTSGRKLFWIIATISALGLIIDAISVILATIITNGDSQTYNIALYIVSAIILFMANFIVLYANKTEIKFATKLASILALIANPGLGLILFGALSIFGSGGFLFVAGIAVVILIAYILITKEAVKEHPEDKNFNKKLNLIILLLAIGIILSGFVSLLLPNLIFPSHGFYQNDSINSITTTLKIVAPSGQSFSDKFQIKSGETIHATNFVEKTDLGASSIKFFIGKFKGNSLLTIGETGDSNLKVSYVNWNGSTALIARAQVICGATATEATNVLARLDNTEYEYSTNDLITYCKDSQPCCAVVLDKP